MSGQSWDGRYGRGRAGPLQAITPVRLPGGVWGPVPATGLVTFDAQGMPTSGYGAIPASMVSSSTARAEWPMPVRWECQFSLSIERVNYVGNPPAPLPIWPIPVTNTVAFAVAGVLQTRIESAQAIQAVELPLGPGVYPFKFATQGVPGLSATLPIVAQQVEFSVSTVAGIGDPALGNSTWQWSVSFLLGLSSAGWPAP